MYMYIYIYIYIYIGIAYSQLKTFIKDNSKLFRIYQPVEVLYINGSALNRLLLLIVACFNSFVYNCDIYIVLLICNNAIYVFNTYISISYILL